MLVWEQTIYLKVRTFNFAVPKLSLFSFGKCFFEKSAYYFLNYSHFECGKHNHVESLVYMIINITNSLYLSTVILFPDMHNASLTAKSLASDGQFLYLYTSEGLFKIGSGYGGTIKGHVYLQKADFHVDDKGWLGYANVSISCLFLHF
jgi:hypothetical protein